MLRYEKETGRMISKEDYISANLGGLPNPHMLADLWEKMPSRYDSEADTLHHIKRVNQFLLFAAQDLLKRAMIHDNSKLLEPEKSKFDEMTPKLKGLTYGSDEYKASLSELGVALKHHYEHNSHHPEHYPDGVNGMDLLDLIEMFFDWCAAGERHADGDIYKSIENNKTRFNLSDQLVDIQKNTAERYYRKNQTISIV